MVYLALSVMDLNKSVEFYTKYLRIFDAMGNERLVCNSGVDLIIDLYRAGTEIHEHIFGTQNYVPGRFSIHHGEHIKLKVIEHLKIHGIEYEYTANIAGVFLELNDPSGNSIGIWGHHGYII